MTDHNQLPAGFAAQAREVAEAAGALNNRTDLYDVLDAATERTLERRAQGRSADPMDAALTALETCSGTLDQIARFAETGEVPLTGFGS